MSHFLREFRKLFSRHETSFDSEGVSDISSKEILKFVTRPSFRINTLSPPEPPQFSNLTRSISPCARDSSRFNPLASLCRSSRQSNVSNISEPPITLKHSNVSEIIGRVHYLSTDPPFVRSSEEKVGEERQRGGRRRAGPRFDDRTGKLLIAPKIRQRAARLSLLMKSSTMAGLGWGRRGEGRR